MKGNMLKILYPDKKINNKAKWKEVISVQLIISILIKHILKKND